MTKKMLMLAAVACLGTIGTCFAAVFANNVNSPFITDALDSTVGHQIVFNTNDSRYDYDEEYKKENETFYIVGFFALKNNATRSGDSFNIDARIDGAGDMAANRDDCLLFCETPGTTESNPSSTVEIEFDLKNVASFESVVIRGEIYDDGAKTNDIKFFTYAPGDGYCTYNEGTNQVEIKGKGFFKALIISIEINYSCVA